MLLLSQMQRVAEATIMFLPSQKAGSFNALPLQKAGPFIILPLAEGRAIFYDIERYCTQHIFIEGTTDRDELMSV